MDSYARFAVAMVTSLFLMFLLSMSMVRTLDHYHLNPSNFYMALVMVAPMGIVMLLVMGGMFRNRMLNAGLYAGLVALFFGALALGRTETFVGNEGFLKSMIPHHSRAILVCEEAAITDPEIERLCEAIVETQRREIDQMKQILERY